MRGWATAGILVMAVLAGPSAWGAPGFTPPAEEAVAYKELPSGRYSVKVIGMLTTTCARGIEIELMLLPQVESAKVDFDKETMILTIKLNHSLPLKTLRKALHLAADRVNLGVDYFVGKIAFLP
ncbi:MAG: heavy metal-associated domain-containing protein [Elusimicrobia bacterium]|nr:heavy metal-associated domain-containing protein [Elusimicrobiota bacterium]